MTTQSTCKPKRVLLGEYANGNYRVWLFSDGTKIRGNDLDNLTPAFVENVDFKITNRCDRRCAFCHEKSRPNGKHCSWQAMLRVADNMQPLTEIAVGGGNPLTHPHLDAFLLLCKSKRVICNITVHYNHWQRYCSRLEGLLKNGYVTSIGISLQYEIVDRELIRWCKQYPSTVLHFINGMCVREALSAYAANGCKILVLGYKNFGDNVGCDMPEQAIDADWLFDVCGKHTVIALDNLAVKQLNVDTGSRYYMGDDGQFSLFVDGVKERIGWGSCCPYEERLPLEMWNGSPWSVYKKICKGKE